MKGLGRRIGLLAAAAILGAVILAVPLPLVRFGAAFVLLWVLPGLAWTSLIPQSALDRIERVAVGLGLSFAVSPVVTLLVTDLPGPVSRGGLLIAMMAGIGSPLALSALRRLVPGLRERPVDAEPRRWMGLRAAFCSQQTLWRGGWAWLLVAVLIAAALRVVNLGYAEFQGDEAAVLVRAAQALEGDEAAVFQHKKGPAELAVVMAGWRLTGMTGEWMARLPFAWAGVLGVAAVFLCGRRLGRPHAGGIAACLLAIEGFFVGFGRIVQYQSLVFALGTLGLLCLFAYRERGRGGLVIAGAAFFACGMLAHYDAMLALPAGLLLVAARLWRDRQTGWRALVPIVIAALVGLALLGLFYVPLLRSSYAGDTSYYLSGRIGSGFYNHLESTFELSAVYDAVYLLAVMGLALAGQIAVTWGRWRRVGLALAVALLALAVTGLVLPERWVVGERTLAWIPFAILLAGAVLAPRQTAGERALWLWLAVPALFYLFLVALPLTHIHTAFPAWALLAGVGLAGLGRWLASKSRIALRFVAVGGVVVYVLCGCYAVMMFVNHIPEYRRTFPQSRNPVYWTPYEQMPEAGFFGFPYRAGWKVVGHLIDEGVLVGTYDSNEEQEITDYYTRQAVRLRCATPDMYVIAANVQDQVPVPWEQIEEEYEAIATITVGDQPKITVYGRGGSGQPKVYKVEAYDRLFDLWSTPDRVAWLTSDRLEAAIPAEYVPYEVTFGNVARLLGYTVDTSHAVPGGYVELTLLWQALEPTPVDYHVFTHLHDGEAMRGQLDGQPVCGGFPTSRWQPGQVIADPYRIPVWGDAPPGQVPLRVGMYDFVTMQRLPVTSPDGAPAGDSVHLTDVEIREP
ncbi:MAG: glycosyltransferase family 39 protein [Anaerolineae bacterium]|nr:glycosyltransferase family 39 protein [Anaerolineae bacterium]